MAAFLVTWGPLIWKYFNKLPMDVDKAKADGWTLTRSCNGKEWMTSCNSRYYMVSSVSVQDESNPAL